ncbi:MAG TPA: GGDEF domain-containing protein, partial [Gammaproteobacteria bacterium]|nr:GGDEF domain-containing protein [Gammaproteobacteria bacterium]
EITVSKRKSVNIAIIMLDIDFFKKINDTYGHESGDEVLKAVAEKITKNIRKSDVVCRYGGEEFLIVFPDTSQDEAKHVSEILREAIKTISLQSKLVLIENITASFGVSAFPENGLTKQELIASADKALYQAKKEGRDRVCLA